MKEGQLFYLIVGSAAGKTHGEEKVDIFDKVEEIIPSPVLNSRGVVCKI